MVYRFWGPGQEVLFQMLETNPVTDVKNFTMGDLLNKISAVKDGKNSVFYIKVKPPSKPQIDFVRGRATRDYLSENARSEFGKQARYALMGISSEIILSKKIKEVVASREVQELAQAHGFTGMKFCEPILAILYKNHRRKYLVYKSIKSEVLHPDNYNPENLALSLRKIFLGNGINPNDLASRQFMITQEDGGLYVVLIDTEAYTKIETPTE